MLFSEPKIPQFGLAVRALVLFYEVSVLFSEPKIPQFIWHRAARWAVAKFQCSSASRKFLNYHLLQPALRFVFVSVLFSEPKIPQSGYRLEQRSPSRVSVLFSEPKIPQFRAAAAIAGAGAEVSVLFSEPKIPQCAAEIVVLVLPVPMFQCSSASRKFLNRRTAEEPRRRFTFQCSSASRKFLNPDPRTCVHPYSRLRRSRFVVPEPSWCVAMTPVY